MQTDFYDQADTLYRHGSQYIQQAYTQLRIVHISVPSIRITGPDPPVLFPQVFSAALFEKKDILPEFLPARQRIHVSGSGKIARILTDGTLDPDTKPGWWDGPVQVVSGRQEVV